MTGPRLTFRFRDNNDKTSYCGFWLPDGETLANSITRANILRDAIHGVSNAQLYGAQIEYDDIIIPLGIAAPESDYRTNLVVIYKDENGINTVRIPSPRLELPYDMTGEWRSFRLMPAALAAAGLLAPLQNMMIPVVFPWGDAVPTTIVVAGADFTMP